MSVLLTGTGLFVIAFFLHVLVWRLKKPKKSIKALTAVFLAVLMAGMMLLTFKSPQESISHIHAAVLFFLLFLAYLFTYSGIEADSPSLYIVLMITGAGKCGLSRIKFKDHLNNEKLILPRLAELAGAGLVEVSGDRYRITGKGRSFLLPFMLYRGFLGLGKGG